MDEKLIWTTGRRGAVVPIRVFEYPKTISASAEAEQITCRQVEKALGAEYPGMTFYAYLNGGPHGFVVSQCRRLKC